MKPKNPTLRDVALKAGVSYQTVSRVINDDDHVSEATRKRVMIAIEELDYRPNRAAQIMQTRKSQTIEVVMFQYGFNRFLAEMARTSHELGYHFVISAITQDEFVDTVESASSRFVDGLILIPLVAVNGDYDKLVRLTHGIPFVQVGAKLGEHIPSVMYDQAQGGRLATQHLIDLGHRKIATITGPLHNYDAYDRHMAWLETLKLHGIEPGPIIEGNFDIDSGYHCMNQLLDQGGDFTSVFIANDSMTFGAHSALREHGLRVPDDVSIVSFDDIPESAHFVPGLTTVRQDFHLLGRLAVEYVVSMINNPKTPIHQRVLQPRLIIRDSTRPLTAGVP